MTETKDTGGTGGGGSGGTTDDDSGWFDAADSLTDIGAGWLSDLKGNVDKLVTIANNPEGFVLGALLSLLVGGILGIFREIVEAGRILLVGTAVGYRPGELVGLEDIPIVLWRVVETPFELVGNSLLDAAAAPSNWAAGIAESAGIAAFPVTVGLYVLIAVITFELIRRSGRATIAAVPVVGTALEAFIYE